MNRWLLTSIGLALLAAGGCNAQSCSCLTPLPFGFPANERTANATQVRVSDTGVAAFEAEPTVVASLLLGGSLAFDVPASCGGSPSVCCTGGAPTPDCGPLVFDVTPQAGDPPRVELTPVQGASRIDLTLRARVASAADIPVNIPTVGDCGLRIDTAPGPSQDVQFSIPLSLVQDATAGTTRLEVGSVTLSGLSTEDVALTGGFGCQFASLGVSFFIGTLVDTLSAQITDSLQASLCKACPSGSVGECGALADACTGQVCMVGSRCLQELGAVGRLSAGALFAGAPPGSAGTLDLYEIAGGYATTNSGGVSLGVLGGMIPSGAERDRCGPPATAPVRSAVPQSAYFQGNVRPDTSAPFDVAIGLHASQLEQFAYAAYEGGVLCPTVGTSELPTLTTDALATYMPSLSNLTGGTRPIAVGLRPQAPPSFVLGENRFDTGGAVVDPLVDLTFDGMEIDVFANVEDQPIRLLTLVADVRLPVGVQIDAAGKLVPVLGAAAGALNVTVESSEALQETGAGLVAVAPVLMDPVLSELVRRLGLFERPAFAGMDLGVTSVTSVDNQSFVALFADLQPPAPASPTSAAASGALSARGSTEVRLAESRALLAGALLSCIGLALLGAARRRARRFAVPAALASAAVAVPLACGGDGESSPNTADSGNPDAVAGGQGGNGGGSNDGGGAAGSGGQGQSGTGGGGQGATDGGLAGSGGAGGNPCGATACLSGDVPHGDLGQWNSVDTGARTVMTSYDALLGDLVLVELSGGVQTRRVVDGVPAVTPTHDPSGYRGGIEAPGPDVGAWTSVRLAGSRVVVAYQDRDRGALRAAFEDASAAFHAHDVDDSLTVDVQIGAYASLALGATPSIAYLATGVPSAGGARTELRLATAASATPAAMGDWSTTVIASAVGNAPTNVLDLPIGPGLFVNLIALGDGRRVLVHYDRIARALVAHVETATLSGTFDETVLDGGGTLDRGRWVSAVADSAGTVHVAYQDAIGHQVFYLTFTPGGAIGTPEVVDDGTRAGDRPHWVGAGLALWLDGGPRIAYQDAANANVVVATKNGSWSHAEQTTGAPLDGFHLAAPSVGAGPLVWDQMDSASALSHRLVVSEMP